jgi:hypothetical protein
MLVRHYAAGKWYSITCPEGSRVVRAAAADDADGRAGIDRLIVPRLGGPLTIPDEPAALLPMLAEWDRAGKACPARGGAKSVEWPSSSDDRRINRQRCRAGSQGIQTRP